MGKNTASYKFALGQSLLDLADGGETFISIEQVAETFSTHMIRHLKAAPKQTTSPSSAFIEDCKKHLMGELSKEALIDSTLKNGFRYVIDVFHMVSDDENPIRFYEDLRSSQNGLLLTDELLKISQEHKLQRGNLQLEIEARWKLVETAWELKLPPTMIQVQPDAPALEFYIQAQARRIDLTRIRDSLNGYQKSRCFYCNQELSISDGTYMNTDVDHFFPHTLMHRGIHLNLNQAWNLVLTCDHCNRGEGGKFTHLPTDEYVYKLYNRNEFLIISHHPLKETIINTTGKTPEKRKEFIESVKKWAIEKLPYRWHPAHIYP